MPPFTDDGFEHDRIGEEFLRRQVREHSAFRQRDDAMRVSRDEIHVVFDQQDRAHIGLAGRIEQRLHDAVLLGRRDTRGRFIEQDDLRIEREGRRDVEQLLLALRERQRNRIEPFAEPEDIGNLGDTLSYLDQPEFAKFWDEDAKRVEDAVRSIGKVEG